MSCVKRRTKGLTSDVRRAWGRVLFCRSSSVWYEGSPVSLRIRIARFFKICGAYVSWRKNNPAICMTPVAIEVAQKTHRQVVFSAMKPPTIGPIDGPRSGAKLKIALAVPRSSGRKLSPRTPPPTFAAECQFHNCTVGSQSKLTTSGTLPPNPDKNRKAISCPVVCAKPQTILKAR